MNSTLTRLAFLFAAVMAAGGCTFPASKSVVPARQANQMQSTDLGTVLKVREVIIEGSRTHLGQYAGAVIGGAAALPKGGANTPGKALGVAGASVVGAVVGEGAEEYLTRKKAQEITVELKNGNVVVIVQESPPDYLAGDHVQVIHSPGGARVVLATGP